VQAEKALPPRLLLELPACCPTCFISLLQIGALLLPQELEQA